MPRSVRRLLALIADEDPIARAALSVAAGRFGLESVLLQNGREAVDALSRAHPSLVLLGAQMSPLNGIEVCLWARRQPHLSDVPVIILGSSPSEFDIDAGLLAGANDYLAKPITDTRIDTVLARHLAGRLVFPPVRVVIEDL